MCYETIAYNPLGERIDPISNKIETVEFKKAFLHTLRDFFVAHKYV